MKEKDQCKYFPWYCDFCDKYNECTFDLFIIYVKSKEEETEDSKWRGLVKERLALA